MVDYIFYCEECDWYLRPDEELVDDYGNVYCDEHTDCQCFPEDIDQIAERYNMASNEIKRLKKELKKVKKLYEELQSKNCDK